jgi:hypothetical protein
MNQTQPSGGDLICVICGRRFSEFGHSAQPVKHGRCCNVCNDTYVIPARLAAARKQNEEDRVK